MRRPRFAVLVAVAALSAAGSPGSAQSIEEKASLASIGLDDPAPRPVGAAPVDAGFAPPPAEPARAGNPLWSIPMSTLSATRDRPLFSASRRRPASAVVAVAPPPEPAPVRPAAPEAPPFALVGTIVGGDRNIAILVNEDSKSSVGVREGEGQSGWTLVSVDRRSAVLEGGGRRVVLDLPTPDGRPGASPAPVAPEARAFPAPEAEGAAPPRAASAARRRNSPNGGDNGQ